MEKQIKAVLILEILGKPAEHIIKVLNEIIDKLSQEDRVTLIKKTIAEPRKIDDKDVFSSFAEIEIQTDLQKLMLLVYAYMPAHIEIVEPEHLEIKNTDLNMFFNELAIRLHQYDEIARTLLMEREMLTKKLQEAGLIKTQSVQEETEKKQVKKRKSKKK